MTLNNAKEYTDAALDLHLQWYIFVYIFGILELKVVLISNIKFILFVAHYNLTCANAPPKAPLSTLKTATIITPILIVPQLTFSSNRLPLSDVFSTSRQNPQPKSHSRKATTFEEQI